MTQLIIELLQLVTDQQSRAPERVGGRHLAISIGPGHADRDGYVTTRRGAGLMAIVGGALIVIGCLMPWGRFASFLNVYSKIGISIGYGVIAAVAGAAALVCGVGALHGHDKAARFTAVPAAMALLSAGWVAISWQLGIGLPEGPGWTGLTGHGLGLVVVAIGAVLGVAVKFAGS